MFNQTAALRPDMPWMWPHRGQTKQTNRLSSGTLESWPALFHCLASVAVVPTSFHFLFYDFFFYVTEAFCVGWQETNSLWVLMGEFRRDSMQFLSWWDATKKWVAEFLIGSWPCCSSTPFNIFKILFRHDVIQDHKLGQHFKFWGIHLGYWLHDKALQLRTTM